MKNSKVFTQEEIKEIRSRISVSVQNTGRFIRETRLQHDLSQSSLGSVLYVTKKAVSKWERGLCYPSMDVLPYLAETLGVTTDEILYAKFDTENKYEDNNKTLNLVYRIFRSKQIKMMIRTLIVIAFILLAWFFVENYNAVKIYTIVDYDDPYIHIENALLVTTKQTEYLNIGYLYLDFPDIDEESQVNYTLYIGEKNKIERVLQEFVSKNYIPHLTNFNTEENPNIKINDNFDKLYLDITYVDNNGKTKNYTIRLNVIMKYQSNDVLNIFKDINERVIKNINFPKLGFPTNKAVEKTYAIDLSFLYEMTDAVRKEKYNEKYIKIDNYTLKINAEIDKMTLKYKYIKYRVEFNNNIIFIEDDENHLYKSFKINNQKIYTESKTDYEQINQIIKSLKN